MFRSAVVLPFSIASVLAAFAVPHGKQRLTVVANASTATVAAAAAQAVTVKDPSVQCEVKVQCDRMDACAAAAPGTAMVFTVAGLPPTDEVANEVSLGVRGLAFVVHPHRELAGLDRAQIADLFLGRIANWQQLGGPNAPVRLLRTTDPDDLDSLSRYLGRSIQTTSTDVDAFHGDERCLRVVAGDPFAIGTMSIEAAERAVAAGAPLRILPLDGMAADTQHVDAGTYPLVRTLQVRVTGSSEVRDRRLLDHLEGEDGERLLRDAGYRPLRRD